MSDSALPASRPTKGKLTALRIMDVAEALFARQGYEGTSLRQIAAGAGIREPGLYNHFSGKQGLYTAVLRRALDPMAETLEQQLEQAAGLRDYTDLPSQMTDMLLENPHMAALLQQALQADVDSVGSRVMHGWLDRLFKQGLRNIAQMEPTSDSDLETLAVNVIAMINVTTGYFLSQRAFYTMAGGDLKSPDNLARQKRLLHKFIRAMLIS